MALTLPPWGIGLAAAAAAPLVARLVHERLVARRRRATNALLTRLDRTGEGEDKPWLA